MNRKQGGGYFRGEGHVTFSQFLSSSKSLIFNKTEFFHFCDPPAEVGADDGAACVLLSAVVVAVSDIFSQ